MLRIVFFPVFLAVFINLNLAFINDEEIDAEFWQKKAEKEVKIALEKPLNRKKPKNVVYFMGDGMSFATIAATRVYMGKNENYELAFDAFPYTALVKTYAVDTQVTDSAQAATAYLCGTKGNLGTVGVTARVRLDDCAAALNESHWAESLVGWAQERRWKTGFVTTTRVTHASPAGVYAHSANRYWESDTEMPPLHHECQDIAYQLVNGKVGRGLQVVMGGGRSNLLPKNAGGERGDGRDLIKEWLGQREGGVYVETGKELKDRIMEGGVDSILGLFGKSHMEYALDKETPEKKGEEQPTLEEMVEAAITVLANGTEGYFLFVEGGLIDRAHHSTLARKALDETAHFSRAILKSLQLVNTTETLVVVTADHAHTLTYAGYAQRANSILGTPPVMAADGKPFATLAYANGPGYKEQEGVGGRYDISGDDMEHQNYLFPALAPLDSETHGGEDVALYALGPWAHLFTGTIEQSSIPHFIKYAIENGDI